MTREDPLVVIVILNWNGWEDTVQCLASLDEVTYRNHAVVVADNGSTDGSLDRLREYASDREVVDVGAEGPWTQPPAPGRLTLLDVGENRGYAGGNNAALRLVLETTAAEYMLLLNNDTEVDPGFLDALVDAAEAHPEAAFLGPKVYHHHEPDVIQFAGGGSVHLARGTATRIGWNQPDRGQHDEPREIDYAGGCSILGRVSAIREIGLLDEAFFIYWEETDWCQRARAHGYTCRYVPSARIWHKEGAATPSARHAHLMTRNAFLFLDKHADPWTYRGYVAYHFGYRLWRLAATYLLYHRAPTAAAAVFRGTRDGLRLVAGRRHPP